MIGNITVGVTGVHVASAPKSGAVVLKELISTVGICSLALVDYPQTCALGWENPNLIGVYQVPQGITGTRSLTERLLEIHQKTPMHVIIPCDDEDVASLASGADILESNGISTLLPSSDAVSSVTKAKLHDTLTSCGIPVPRQTTIWDLQEIVDNHLILPLIVKGRLIHAYLARNPAEVHAFASKLYEVWGYPVILQEYVDGEEYSVAAVADRDSKLSGICAIRKLGISDQGKTWLAVTISPENFEPIIASFLKKVKWVGPFEMEFIASSDGSSPVAIEVNPRFPAWIPVARAAGADLIKRLVEICRDDKPLDLLVARAGMCFARTYHTNVFAMQKMAMFFTHQEYLSKDHDSNEKM
jgi:carbamoyl-phosphate synthase large subunit